MIDKTWLNDYIEQMEFEVQENEKDSYTMSEVTGNLECPEDYYCLGLYHGEQKGVLSALKLNKEKLDE